MRSGGRGAPIGVALFRFKTVFRRWYGILSIKEIAENRALAMEIAHLEWLLNQAVG
ncbi:hypothetical protein FACS1894176_10660 [Bacteroidia bacterium]|jgi:hypothetical protein|nr:hypothetical protein FACS1894176_10660 [Bacteroidia bacterium]